MSFLGHAYQSVYDMICGKHPNYFPWHFQWIFLFKAHAWQRSRMKNFHGRVLDVGCGDKPYASWVNSAKVDQYIGLDVIDGADIKVVPGEPWPIEDTSIDCVLFTQVMEHLADRDQVLGEIERVLKPGGHVLITVPFLFPAHGLPYDYARFTVQGLQALFEKRYEIVELTTAGGAGTVMASTLLTWIETVTNVNLFTRILKGAFLPVWLLVALLGNAVGKLIDALDATKTHYANVCMVVRKGDG